MQIPRAHLVTLLNALHRTGTDRITVRHPSEQIGELLTISLAHPTDTTVAFHQDIDDYRAVRDQVQMSYGERPYDDLPDTSTYVQALTASGILPIGNEEEVLGYVDRHGYRDLESGHRPVVLGIDTNLIAWGLPDVLGIDHLDGNRDSAGRSPTNGYALTTGVKEELDWHYKHYTTHRLVDAFGEEFGRLTDQPAGANRCGFLGLYAYRNLIAHRNVDVIQTDIGDSDIIDGYRSYHDANRKVPLLLSNDRGFIEEALERDLLAQHVSFSPVIPHRVPATWTQVVDLLYHLSIAFGVLVLPKVTLYGVWNGKSGIDWQHEALDVDFRSPKVEPLVDRQMRVLDVQESI